MSARPPHIRVKIEPENRYGAERRSQVRGLLLLAVAAIVFAILRAGVKQAFNPGWWRLW